MRRLTLKFRAVNRNIFEAIASGTKKVETRAATSKYKDIKPDNEITFTCGNQRFHRRVRSAKIYKNVGSLLKEYKIKNINPFCKNKKELIKMYDSFPGYKEKIRKFGLIAIELK